MNWSIGKKILFGYLIALVLLMAIGAGAFWGVRELLAAGRLQEHAGDVIDHVDRVQMTLITAESAQRGYLLSGQDVYLTPCMTAVARVPVIIAELRQLIADDADQQVRLARFESIIQQRLKLLEDTVAMRRDQGSEAAFALFSTGKGRELMEKVNTASEELRTAQADLLAAREKESEQSARRVYLIILAGTAAAGLILLLVGIVVARSIARPLAKITRAAEQIASGDPAVALPDSLGRSDEVGQFHAVSPAWAGC